MTRREFREHVFKLLFVCSFHPEGEYGEQFERYFDDMGVAEHSEIRRRVESVLAKTSEIDAILTEVSTGWKPSRMAREDLEILRLAVYEIKYDEDIPEKVSINEAVELAKTYGGDDSYSFVNGVLAKLVRGKEAASETPKEAAETSKEATDETSETSKKAVEEFPDEPNGGVSE